MTNLGLLKISLSNIRSNTLHKKTLLTKPAKHWPRLRKETGRKRQEKKQIILNGAVPAGDPVKITRWLESYMKLKEMLLIPRNGRFSNNQDPRVAE